MDESRQRGMVRVAGVVVATLVVIYAANLSQLVLADKRARTVEASLIETVAHERAGIDALELNTTYALTDAAAEEFARDQKDWVLPGDHPVIVVPVDEVPPESLATVPAAPSEPSAWQRLVGWLKGE
jgi:hypothetical protein